MATRSEIDKRVRARLLGAGANPDVIDKAAQNDANRKRIRAMQLAEAERNLRMAERDRTKMGTISSKVGRFMGAAQKVNQRAKDNGLMNFGREVGAAAYAQPGVRENIDAGVATITGSTGELADRTARWYAGRPEGPGQMTRGEKMKRAIGGGIKKYLPDSGTVDESVPVEDYTGMYEGSGVGVANAAPVSGVSGAGVAPTLPPATYGGILGPQFSRQRLAEQRAGMGIRQTNEVGDQKLTRLEAQLNQTRDTKKREGIQAQINDIRGRRIAGEERAGQQSLAQMALQGEITKAVAGDAMAMAKMRNDYAVADRKAQGDMLASFAAGLARSDTVDPAQIPEMIKQLIQGATEAQGGQTAQPGGQTAQTQSGDINADGKISAEEQEYNQISAILKNSSAKMQPIQIDRAKQRLAELKKKLVPSNV